MLEFGQVVLCLIRVQYTLLVPVVQAGFDIMYSSMSLCSLFNPFLGHVAGQSRDPKIRPCFINDVGYCSYRARIFAKYRSLVASSAFWAIAAVTNSLFGLDGDKAVHMTMSSFRWVLIVGHRDTGKL